MKYTQSSRAVRGGGQFMEFTGGPGGQGACGNRSFGGAGAALGTILAKDANSITVQLIGGANASSTNDTETGSKIVLYSGPTDIGKTVAGSAVDLKVGENVVVNGAANSDGSITAQTIQIRSAAAARPGGIQ